MNNLYYKLYFMKCIKTLICLFITGILSSCLDSEEKIVINDDNSGTYTLSLDLSKYLKFEASLGDKPDYGRLPRKLDSTIYLKNYLDTASNFSAEEKGLYRDAVVLFKVDAEKNAIDLIVICPFKKVLDLTLIKTNFFKVFDRAMGKPNSNTMKQVNPLAQHFTFLATAEKITNTITDMDLYKNATAIELAFSQGATAAKAVGLHTFRTIFVLPKPVKNYNGPGSILSADKKNITFQTDYIEMLEHPEKVSYAIEF